VIYEKKYKKEGLGDVWSSGEAAKNVCAHASTYISALPHRRPTSLKSTQIIENRRKRTWRSIHRLELGVEDRTRAAHAV
jgi:hypothetical protein